MKAREPCVLGRLQNRTADLMLAQWAVMESLAQEDARRVELAEKRVSRCQERLRQAALSLDRVLAERGGEDGRRLVEGALRITESV